MVGRLLAQVPPARAQRFEALDESDARFQRLARGGGVARPDGVEVPEFELVHADLGREIVHQGLMGDGGLGHAEAAEGAAGWRIGVPGAPARGQMGHPVGAARMDRHPPRHRRPPGGVGARIEVGQRLDRLEPPVRIAAEAGRDARGVALGRGGHALGPVIDAGDRPVHEPGGERHQGLD